MPIRHFLTALMLTLMACSAAAFDRPFPSTAKRGTMSPAPYPYIIVNETKRNFPPGARIWNSNNMIDMPGSIVSGTYMVNYTENLQGDIDQVWILTNEEASRPAPNKLP